MTTIEEKPEPGYPIVKPEVVFIEELLDELERGKLRVPRFQRPFVWKPSDILELFDSIMKGYPIGSLLLWDALEPVESLSKIGPAQLPVSSGGDQEAYILDGHQRLTTLYGGLRLQSDYPLSSRQSEWRWWVWYDLDEERFSHVTNGKQRPSQFPIRAALRTVDFLSEARRLVEECPEKADIYIDRAERLAQQIKSYKVPITRIRGGGLSEAVEIYSRLNTRGVSMAPDEMMAALTYREGETRMNLAERIDQILEELATYNYGTLKRLTVLRAIVAAANQDIYKTRWEVLARRISSSELDRIVTETGESLLRSAEFLKNFLQVPSDRLLPYTNQILLLSEFFHFAKTPSDLQLQKLKRWFWSTSLSGWFAGANTTQLNEAIQEMRSLAQDENTSFRIMPVDMAARPFPGSFDMRGARIRSFLIFLLSQKPLDLETGKEIDVIRILERNGSQPLPHIFPTGLGDLVSSPANRIFAIKYPGIKTSDMIIEVPEGIRELVHRSHGINSAAYHALKEGDARKFVELRAAHLSSLEREFMNVVGVTPPSGQMSNELDFDTEESP